MRYVSAAVIVACLVSSCAHHAPALSTTTVQTPSKSANVVNFLAPLSDTVLVCLEETVGEPLSCLTLGTLRNALFHRTFADQ